MKYVGRLGGGAVGVTLIDSRESFGFAEEKKRGRTQKHSGIYLTPFFTLYEHSINTKF